MAKVTKETQLIISLFRKRTLQLKETAKSYFGSGSESWAKGVIFGLAEAENFLAGIIKKLEEK